MNSINISHSHSYEKDIACKKAEEMIEDIATKYGLTIESCSDGEITFSGSGINGFVTISGENIEISATLGFLMVAMKSIISNEIKLQLEENFS